MNEKLILEATRRELVTRFDSNATPFLERQLTFLRQKIQEVRYPENLALTFVPLATDIPASAETYAWQVLDEVGEAKVGANETDDLPRVDVSNDEREGHVVNITASYGWGISEMEEAARLQIPLGDRKARAARKKIDLQIDNVVAKGQTTSQTTLPFTGFVNNTDVTNLGVIDATGDPWDETTDPDDILATLNEPVRVIVEESKQVWYPDTYLLPTREFMIASQRRVGTNENAQTVLRAFLENNPFIKNIAPWDKLTAAGAGGKSRGVVYKRDPEVLEAVVPMMFRQEAPQARNLGFIVPCRGRAGGTKIYHPLGVRYVDFAQS